MVADVQSWVDDPALNFGWILIGDETQASTKQFDSRENVVPIFRPQLLLEYSIPLVGDANGDNKVDLEDFVILKTSFGQNPLVDDRADFDGDGDIDLDDFVILKNNFGGGGA